MNNSINNIQFKGIYEPKKSRLNNAQKEILDDIKNKLGKESERKDFLIKPINKDKVQLSRIYGVQEKNKKKLIYTGKKYIGTYNKENPFNIEDYKKVVGSGLKDVIGAISTGLLFLGMIFGGLFLAGKYNTNKKIETQKVMKATTNSAQKITKDSLQTLKLDTVKLLKK